MIKNIFLVGLLVFVVVVTSALAETPSNKLKGTWILDAKATENYVVGSPLPLNAHKLAEWFGVASGYMCLFTYDFEGDIATSSAYRGARTLNYRLISQQGAETKYTLVNATGSPADSLSVSILNNGNIRVVPSGSPEMGYLLWKRGQLKTEQATPHDVKTAMDAWLASLQNIVKFLNASPNNGDHP